MKTLRRCAEDEVAAIITAAGNARGKAVAAELAAMRKAFDAATQSIETLLTSPLRVDAEVGTFVDGLTKQFEALAAPAGDVEALQKQLADRETQNQELRTAARQGPHGPRGRTVRSGRRA